MEKLTTDIVVLGTGGAGMTAAIRAAELGAKVVILEKRPCPGGTSNTPMCVAVTKKDQAYRDKAFQVHMEMTQQAGNGPLVRTWINKSGEIPEFLERQGYQLGEIFASATLETMGKERGYGVGFPNGYFIHDVYFLNHRGKGHGSAMLIRHLVGRAEELGIDIHYSTPAKKLIKTGDKVTGVLAETKDGKEIEISAKAVVVAAGGFNDDAEMIAKYGRYGGFKLDPSPQGSGENGGDLWFAQPWLKLTGDGIKMAEAVGADKGGIGIGLIPNLCRKGVTLVPPWILISQLVTIQEQPYLWVNQQGRRYYNESFSDEHMTQTASIARQNPKFGYLIFDAATKRRLEEHGPEHQYFIFPASKIEDLDGQITRAREAGNPDLWMADSLEDLSAETGIDLAGLKDTIEEYNGFCDKGHDDLFGKDPKYLFPVREPKFYCMRVRCCAYQTIGGIRVTGKTEAVTPDRKVIPGLYAAGDIVAGEMYGDPPINGCGTLSIAMGTGLAAAEYAMEYIGK